MAAGTAEIADTEVVADAGTAATGTPLETDEVAGSDAAAEPEIPVVMAQTVAVDEALAVELGVHRNGRRPAGPIRATPPIVVIGDEDGNAFASVPVDEAPVSVDAGPAVAVDPDDWDLPSARDEPPVRDEPQVRDEAPVREEPPVPDEPLARAEMPGAEAPMPTKPARRATRSGAARGVATRPATTRPRAAMRPSRGTAPHAPQPAAGPVAVVASCPYCALLLDPPPEADRRCVRCRQRIMVKRVQGRAVYLTEAAVEVFEAERRRVANLGHWTRDRGRWLKLAASVGAPAGRIDRLERAALSDEVVAAARSLYEATVERRVRVARRDRRWDEASRLRLDQALALYRVAGSPPPAARRRRRAAPGRGAGGAARSR